MAEALRFPTKQAADLAIRIIEEHDRRALLSRIAIFARDGDRRRADLHGG